MDKKLYKLMNWPKIEEIIYSECDNPHEILGPHKVGKDILFQCYYPGAVSVKLRLMDKRTDYHMEMVDDGFFAFLLPAKEMGEYRYVVNDNMLFLDAYRHEPLITREDTNKFSKGIHYTIYEKLGAHPCELDGEEGTYFAVWAPNAVRVSVVGDFNHWDGRIHQMRRLWDSGIFELFVPQAMIGMNYKFEIKANGGMTYLKADPYANAAQLRPESASVITDIGDYPWQDEEFIANREKFQTGNVPMSVYEVYLGAFMKPSEGNIYASYREITPKLIEYVKKMGYTHVELMPVMEHPLDESWGYQTIGYYAPTARYGSPEDFMYFINELHKAGIGVILDWTPAQFPKDAHGLCGFDGTCLYEHLDPRQGEHAQWGTLLYNYGRPQVSNYLIANALFWVEKYHADGIRLASTASMLYLDYGKRDGEWVPNMYGGNENLEAIEFMKHLNSIMKKRNPGVLSIAEGDTSFPNITGNLKDGGLGFDLKYNTIFINDYMNYIQNEPYYRSQHHGELTFSTIYAYSEKFLSAISHDEVVHGKGGLVCRMPGSEVERLANLRLTYAYLMTHPGKKLLFMGQDMAETDEWNERRLVDWEIVKAPMHAGVATMYQELNYLYRAQEALYALDDSEKGFEWINAISGDECYLSYLRKGIREDDILLVVANFSGVTKEIRTGVPYEGRYQEIFNTDDEKYGGNGVINAEKIKADGVSWDYKAQSICVKLAPLSLSILRFEPYTQEELEKVIAERIRNKTIVAKNPVKKIKGDK